MMKKQTQNPVNSTTMISPLFYLIFLLTSQIISAADPIYQFTEHTLLNCGAASRLPSSDGQSWEGDAGTKLSPDISSPSLSSPATTEQDSSITSPVPYVTARIIHSKFSYIFPLSAGQKILRLYFYPATYLAGSGGAAQSFDKTQSFFGVTANQYTLLTNFSAFLTASRQKPTSTYFVKEFIVNVQHTQALNLTFLPSPNSYAFINGIEVVSVPENFYMGSHNPTNNPLTYVNSLNSPYSVDENVTAFETVYRVNVGGGTVTGEGDTGMFRNWLQDDSFLSGGIIGNPLSNETMPLTFSASQTPNYSAPATVYQTARAMGLVANQTPAANLTWNFEVDTGFFYILRMHFCEFLPGLFSKEGQKVFTIFINNMTADEDADIIYFAGGTGIPVFRDYVVSVGNPTGQQSKYNLFLALAHAGQFGPAYLDASLNGLEIFKLSTTTTGNLAGVNPDPLLNPGSSSPNSQQRKKKKSSIGMIAGIIGGVAGAAALIFLLVLFIGRRRRGTTDFDGKSTTKSSWAPFSTQSKSTMTAGSYGSSPLPYDLCRRFSLDEIKTATSDFDPALVIGTGGFGKVYKGFVDNSLTAVAIKRLDTTSRQGAHEFRTEIEMLSNLRHVHLVSLIGYCDENKEMILVYDYMSNGTLRDHLYRTENPPLTWKSRLQVAAGAARGLNYLHSGAKHNIIHRDVKSTNILLDEKYVAKVSDFGLSKIGPTGGHQSHVSTVVKGSFGYVDPEYYKKQQLTEKSDVYSFGVVLFEILCARPAIVATLSRDQVNLAEWARRCNKKGTIDQMVDPNLRGQIAPECLKSYSDIAMNCLKDQGSDRPAMSDVVWSLEFALQLQEAADKDGDNRERPIVFAPFSPETDATTVSIDDDSATLTGGMLTSSGMMKGQSDTTGGLTSSSNSATDDKLKSASVFSEIMNPAGR